MNILLVMIVKNTIYRKRSRVDKTENGWEINLKNFYKMKDKISRKA